MSAPVAVRARSSRFPVRPIPLVTVLPAPRIDPPYDDEHAPEPWLARQEAPPRLPLEWPPPADLPGPRPPATQPAAERQPALSASPALAGHHAAAGHHPAIAGHPALSGQSACTAQPAPAGGPAVLPRGGPSEARIAVRRFLAVLLEVLDGYRPAGHLRRLTLPSAFAAVTDEVARAARRGTRAVTGPRAHRFRLRELRVCEPRTGAVEVAAVLGRGECVFAVALRLEQTRASWLCTVAQVV
ncbi:MAG TPA: Rv3235 family protein [Micromonosporaceae bacterium]|nr:Rv3235 family protein [Micromonosporaceae bacterium]